MAKWRGRFSVFMNMVLALLLCFSTSFGIANAYQDNAIANYDLALQENAHQQFDLDNTIDPFADSVRMYGYYDRDAAVAYASQYYYRTCSDGIDFRSYGLGGDCAHFVSCSIGNEGNQRGGGLSLGYHVKSPAQGGGYYYGWAGAENYWHGNDDLIPFLLDHKLAQKVSSIGELQKGDIIRYAIGTGHLALYLGNGLIADHHGDTPSSGGYYGKPYTIYSTSGIEYYHIYDNPPLPSPSKSFPINSVVCSNADGLNVREGPGRGSYNIQGHPDDYKPLGTVNKNSTGTVVAGPATLDGRFTWWLIRWSTTLIGWSAQDYLDLKSVSICNLAGYVLNATNNNPIPNASINITVGGQSYSTTSNSSGYYSFSNIPAGSCQAIVQASGFQTWQETFTLNANQTNSKNFKLTPTQASWVFLYYMSNGSDARLDGSIKQKFQQVAQGCANSNIKAYFLWDHLSGQDGVYLMTTNQDWTTYKEGVNFWPPPLAGISSQYELNMGDPATLKNFVLWVLAREGANRNYALIIFDHGSGIYHEANIRREEPSGICFDGSDYLSVKELGDAAAYFASLNHRPISVLHLDACLMQMIEVNYQLRSSCDYLVASQNEGWGGWFEYSYLSKVQSSSQPKELAENIALAYFGMLINWNLPGTVSVTKPGETNRILNAISNFSIALWNNMDKLRVLDGVIRDHVQKFAYPYWSNTEDTNNWFVDLEDFCYEIKEHVADTQLANKAQAVIDALGNPGGNFILLERHQSGDYYDPVAREYLHYYFDKGTYGISILFPPSSANPSHYTSENFEFCRDSYWDEFIKAYTSTARLRLTSPEGGAWKIGEVCPITWTYANLSGNISIQLSRDGGNTYSETLATSVPVTNGRWDWTVTGPASSSCKIRIQSLSYSYICDISDQVFSISETQSKPLISFTPSSFTFTAVQGGTNPNPQTLKIRNGGGGTLNWTVSDDASWLTLSPLSG
ncbi:MAG: clostripain-related cysteine peptidase, partial [bacterium]